MRGSVAVLVTVAVSGCHSPTLPIEKLEDPASCKECHPQHYAEWSGSMHAYASDDPVFVAMNRRGQREAHLGTFCVQCHAPMAVALGLTDGTSFDPSALPPKARGITCYFCHDVAKIVDDHNNGLRLALDDNMRGGVTDPVDNSAHHSSFDPMMASSTNNSQMCGSCHDVVTPRGVALERSYQEWKTTIFATNDPAHQLPLTCSGCHMKSEPSITKVASSPSADVRSRPNSFHEHLWPGIDEAVTPFPQPELLAAAIARDLDPALTIVGPTPNGGIVGGGGICVSPQGGGVLTVRIDTRGTGHMWPTGAAQDRRAWLEVIAYDASNQVVFSSGVVPDDKDPEDDLFRIWDRDQKTDGSPAEQFWDVATVQSSLLRPPVTLVQTNPAFDHSSTATFVVGALYGQFDHITARVRIRPFSRAVIAELVASGDLDPALARPGKTLDIAGATRHWTKAAADAVAPSTGCGADPYQ